MKNLEQKLEEKKKEFYGYVDKFATLCTIKNILENSPKLDTLKSEWWEDIESTIKELMSEKEEEIREDLEQAFLQGIGHGLAKPDTHAWYKCRQNYLEIENKYNNINK